MLSTAFGRTREDEGRFTSTSKADRSYDHAKQRGKITKLRHLMYAPHAIVWVVTVGHIDQYQELAHSKYRDKIEMEENSARRWYPRVNSIQIWNIVPTDASRTREENERHWNPIKRSRNSDSRMGPTTIFRPSSGIKLPCYSPRHRVVSPT